MAASFGQLLRQHRVAASLTQEALAERCQLSPATIAALENGRRKAPRLSTVRDIAEALGLTPPDRAALAAAAGATGGEAAFADVPARVETMTRSQRRSALPSPITPLIGRHVAVAELAQSLVVDRLVTLAGPGGVGKTRLALRAAAEAADKFPGGTCWVELGSVTDPDGVPLALLQSLGGSYHPAVQVEEQIGALLADDPMLFVVDNCEHVLDAAADSVGALLAHANVTVLATSREALAIPGEVVWPVPALAVPADDTPADDDSLAAFDSVQLFVERAARARPGFSLTVASAEPVARIARRLEGNPLAIELTAARMRVLPVEQLADEVDEAFSLTAGRARGVPGRQTTLWASIDWSYQLLAEDERWAFRCLAAFVGPFTAPAFAAVAGVASDDALATLAAKSLVSLASDGGYRVLDTIRSYAAEQAAAVGELERIKDAHAAHMVDWLASIGAGEATDETLDLIDAQYPNFRAALLWSIETRSPAAVALVGSFGVGWHQLSNFHDAIALGDAALEIAAEVDPPARPRLVGMLAMCRLLAGDSTFITTTLPQGAADAEAVGDQLARGWCQLIIGSRPPFDPAYLLDAYQLALAVESPMLAALAAASITYGGTEADNDDWLDRAEYHASALPNTSLRATWEMARADDWTERGRLEDALRVAMSTSLDPRAMPGMRMVAVGHVVHVAFLRADLELAELAMTIRQELGRIWPLGGWQFIRIRDLRVDWLHGERPQLTAANSLAWVPRMGLNPGSVRAACRASLDRGEHLPVELVAQSVTPGSPGSLLAASYAAVRGAQAVVSGDEELARRHWLDALGPAVDRGYVVLACDALEALGALAAGAADSATAATLLASASAARDEIGYRFRFTFEQHAVDSARQAIGPSEARPLPWTEAGRLAVDRLS